MDTGINSSIKIRKELPLSGFALLLDEIEEPTEQRLQQEGHIAMSAEFHNFIFSSDLDEPKKTQLSPKNGLSLKPINSSSIISKDQNKVKTEVIEDADFVSVRDLSDKKVNSTDLNSVDDVNRLLQKEISGMENDVIDIKKEFIEEDFEETIPSNETTQGRLLEESEALFVSDGLMQPSSSDLSLSFNEKYFINQKEKLLKRIMSTNPENVLKKEKKKIYMKYYMQKRRQEVKMKKQELEQLIHESKLNGCSEFTELEKFQLPMALKYQERKREYMKHYMRLKRKDCRYKEKKREYMKEYMRKRRLDKIKLRKAEKSKNTDLIIRSVQNGFNFSKLPSIYNELQITRIEPMTKM